MTRATFASRARARVRAKRRPGEMNATETAFAAVLDGKRRTGEIQSWRFEPIQLILAHDPRVSYTPDFMVIAADGEVVLYEVKAAWKRKDGTYTPGFEDDARTKVRTAAGLFQEFHFRVAARLPKKAGHGWMYEEISR